ncbi:MAG: tetratricopeptide repeat protein [Pseudomonadota bacterium]
MSIFILFAGLLSLATIACLVRPLLERDRAREAGVMRMAGVAAAGLIPLSAIVIYLQIGTPAGFDPAEASGPPAEDPAAAIAALPPEERAAMIDNMVEGLAARLEENPEDREGWRMLARSYAALGRYEDSAQAWREALALSGGEVADWRGLALALMEGGNAQTVAPAVKEALEEVLLQAPDDAMALYFLGFAARAEGDEPRARELWARLRKQVPNDAPLADQLDGLLGAGDSAPEE